MLSADELAPTEAAVEAELARHAGANAEGQEGREEGAGLVDPRIKLPFPINPDAWAHRALVKHWEHALGWSILVSNSTPAITLAAMIVLGLGAWWFSS